MQGWLAALLLSRDTFFSTLLMKLQAATYPIGSSKAACQALAAQAQQKKREL
jgi:hypothetical protein